MSGYAHGRLADLEKQLLLSPPAVRGRHADRLEELIASLDPDADYSYEFIYFRATGFRPQHAPLESFRGRELRADLALLLERVSQSAPSPAAESPEPVLSVEQVAAACKVARRTVYRWRGKGLLCRKYVFPDGAHRIGVRKSALDRFVQANRELVDKSRGFARLSDAERRDILAQARRLARGGELSRTAAAERIARGAGRAMETVRRALAADERENPHDPAFGRSRARLGHEQKLSIHRAYRAGHSVASLCERFGRSRASIHRIVNEARARALLADPSLPGPFIEDEEFSRPGADERMLAPPRSGPTLVERYAGQLPEPGPLDAQQQKNLLRRYNYLKYKAARRKAQIRPERYVPAGLLDDIEALLAAAGAIKQRLVEACMPLVRDVARQHAGRVVDREDLVSEGATILKNAIDTFDYTGRGAFAGYVRWALMRSFARTVPEEHY